MVFIFVEFMHFYYLEQGVFFFFKYNKLDYC